MIHRHQYFQNRKKIYISRYENSGHSNLSGPWTLAFSFRIPPIALLHSSSYVTQPQRSFMEDSIR